MAHGSRRRITVLVLVPLLSFFAWKMGIVAALGNPGSWHHLVAEHAVLGAVLYVLVHAVFSAAGVPSVVFLVPATFIFPKLEAFALGMAGALLGSWLGFALARSTFRSWVEPRVPRGLRHWDARIAENELLAVTTIRLTFFLLPPVAWALGLTKVRTLPYLVGTFLGILPGVLFFTYVGGSFFDWLAAQPAWVWIAFLLAVGAFVVWKRRAPDDETEDTSE
jgi:uncharacterized membrane protein YdjX (TVP38/TMEM64 family)